jgi:cytochrome d ubiquinol oxidase subunit I
MDAVTLARIQFATNISFHILFPTITIALGWVLFWFRLQHRRTRNEAWLDAYRLWVKVFALSFALGVVSGVTMSFQFGTNWPGFMTRVGNVAGPLLAYEVLTAFFLEATFLGIMLFGIGRVSERVHTMATLLVAGGTTLSAFWILVLNSWMQTPAGHELRDGVVHAVDWAAIVFNPSMPYRVTHMLLASGLTVSFLIAGLSAYRWLRNDRSEEVRLSLRFACTLAAVLIPLQILAGDLHGLNTLKHQPAKIAAIEGLWETTRGAPLLLFGVPDEAGRRNDYEIAIPGGASLILDHDRNAEIKGLNEFEGRHPPVAPVFWSFRVMVGTGLAMLAVSWLAAWRLRRGDGTLPVPLLRVLVGMTFAGWVATLAGWYVTEIGRQPFLVYDVLLTREAASAVPAPLIGLSLSMYLLLYALLMSAYVSVVFHLARKAGLPGDPLPARASRPPLGGMAGA